MAWSCGACRAEVDRLRPAGAVAYRCGFEWQPGSFYLGPVRTDRVLGLLTAGWTLEDAEPPDLVCPHYWGAPSTAQ